MPSGSPRPPQPASGARNAWTSGTTPAPSPLAAATRFRVVIDKYQTTTHTPEALERLVESYLALGIPSEAQKAAAVLGRNYPGSEWYHRSYRLIQRHVPQATPQS